MKQTIQNSKFKIVELLRWSEQYTQTDMVYLARGGFWLTALQVVGAGSALVLSIIFANYFPKHEFGVYKYAISLSGILGAISLTGIGVALTRSVAKGINGSLIDAFWINLKWSGAMSLSAIVGAIYFYLNSNATLGLSLAVIAIINPIVNSLSLYGSFLAGKGDFRTLSAYGFWRNVLPTGALIAVILVTDSVLAIVATYFLSNLIINLALYLATVRKYLISKERDVGMESYAKHLSLMNVLGVIAEHLDKIIVFQYVGAVELAVYTFATAIPTQIKGSIKSLYQLAFPKFANRELSDLRKDMPGKLLKMVLVTLPIVLIYIILAPFIFKIIFPAYIEAVPYSQIFSLSLLFYSSLLINTAMQSKGMVETLYYSSVATAIGKILTISIFSLLFGLWGVIIARVVNELLSLLINSYLFWKKQSYLNHTLT